jgi:hypothetical protein
MPAQQQEKALSDDAEFQKLPTDVQQRLRDRLRWFNDLPAERKQKIIDRMDRFGHMNQAQQERARVLFERSRLLPPERHRAVRRAFNRLQEMPRAERQQEMQSDRFRSAFNPEERSLLDEMLSLADEVEQTNQQP